MLNEELMLYIDDSSFRCPATVAVLLGREDVRGLASLGAAALRQWLVWKFVPSHTPGLQTVQRASRPWRFGLCLRLVARPPACGLRNRLTMLLQCFLLLVALVNAPRGFNNHGGMGGFRRCARTLAAYIIPIIPVCRWKRGRDFCKCCWILSCLWRTNRPTFKMQLSPLSSQASFANGNTATGTIPVGIGASTPKNA